MLMVTVPKGRREVPQGALGAPVFGISSFQVECSGFVPVPGAG